MSERQLVMSTILSRTQHRAEIVARYKGMMRAVDVMSVEDYSDLVAWERDNLDGHSVATSDWPRWGEFIAPLPPAPLPRRRARTVKAPIPKALRWEVWRRDGFTCRGCGVQDDLQVDHVVPESLGGSTTEDNLQTLCGACNAKKGTR